MHHNVDHRACTDIGFPQPIPQSFYGYRNSLAGRRKNGIIVYLDRPISDIKITSNRPLTRSVDDLKKKYYERHEMYEKSADITVMVKGSEKSTLSTLINALKDVKV